MANINTFSVGQYGTDTAIATRLLNMDGFVHVQPVSVDTTFVKYLPPFGDKEPISIILTEAFADVMTKLKAKTPAGIAELSVASLNGEYINATIGIDSKYFLNAYTDGSTSTLYINNPTTDKYDRYVVNGDLSYIITNTSTPTGNTPFFVSDVVNITVSGQVITMSHNFGTLNDYSVVATMLTNGGIVEGNITRINGTQFSVAPTATGLMAYTATAI